MNVITITREYGAGGGEVARKLAEALGWELLDRELLHQAAEIEHVPDAELERLDEKAITMADRFRLHPPHQKYLHGLKEAVGRRAAAGQRRSSWAVAPGTCWASSPTRFHLRLVAPQAVAGPADGAVGRLVRSSRPWPAARRQTASASRFTRYFFGDKATQPAQYDLVFNTAARASGRRGGRGRGDRPAGPAEPAAAAVPPAAGS